MMSVYNHVDTSTPETGDYFHGNPMFESIIIVNDIRWNYNPADPTLEDFQKLTGVDVDDP